MATDISTSLQVTFDWQFKNALGLSSVKDKDGIKHIEATTFGTGSDQTNELWHDRRFVTPSTVNDDIDLSGVLTNAFGESVTFTKIKKLVIINLGVPDQQSGSVFTPTIGENLFIGGSSNPWDFPFNEVAASVLSLYSGGVFVLSAPLDGLTVTAATADILRIAHDGADDIMFDIIIEGLT